MQKGLALKHGRKLVRNTTKQSLNGGRVADEGGGSLGVGGSNAANRRQQVVGDPFHEMARVLGLNFDHFVIDVLHRHISAKLDGGSQVAAVARVAGSHHVARIKHGLSKRRNGLVGVALVVTARQGGSADQEKVQTSKRNQVHGKLAQVSVQLTRKTQRAGHTTHHTRHKRIQIGIPFFKKTSVKDNLGKVQQRELLTWAPST